VHALYIADAAQKPRGGENQRQVYRNSDANRLPPIDGQQRLDAALAGPGTWVVVLRTRHEVRAFLEATGRS
jgi:hypothetical protein